MVNYHPRLKLVHGFRVRQHPLYYRWVCMRSRCEDPNCPQFYNYGGRGIFVCKEWSEAFEPFAIHMGLPPTPEHTLDRINNELGYFPDNCRWVTRTEQCLNRRTFTNNTTGATGITRVENGSFNARYDEEHVRYNLGMFLNIESAIEYRNEFIYLLHKDKEVALQMTERRANLNSSTKIKGISKHSEGFMARFTLPSKERIFVGFSNTLEGAIKLQTDFSELYKISPEEAISAIKNRARSQSISGVKGITAKGSEFIVRVTLKDKSRKYLGCFKTLEEAKTVLNTYNDQNNE